MYVCTESTNEETSTYGHNEESYEGMQCNMYIRTYLPYTGMVESHMSIDVQNRKK